MKLLIDNWRWADVPFYLRTGKRLPARNTQIVIQFRRAPFVLFRDTPVENLMPNQLVLHIQPEEGISLRFGAKVPGPPMRLGSVDMNFDYADYFGIQPSTGYERLLHDCMIGDATLFQRADMVEAGWCVVSPVSTCGKRCRRAISPTTPPAPGARRKPTNFWSATAAAGGTSRNDSGRRYWRHQRSAGISSMHRTATSAWSSEGVFPSREHAGLDEIVAKFVDTRTRTGRRLLRRRRPGPQRPGRNFQPCPGSSSPTAWPMNSSSRSVLINDLEANAWGISSSGTKRCGRAESA